MRPLGIRRHLAHTITRLATSWGSPMSRVQPPEPPYLGPARFHGDDANKPISRVVIHCTVSPCVEGGARATARYFAKTVTRPSSAHYVVDPTDVVQVVYDSVEAFHAPPNRHSLGVELCDPQAGPESRWYDTNHDAMLRRAAALVAQLCLAYDVPIRRLSVDDLQHGARGICGHVDVSYAWHQTTHTDPGTGFPWSRFMTLVRAAAEDLQQTAKPRPVPTPSPAPSVKHQPAPVDVATYNLRGGRKDLKNVAREIGGLVADCGVVGFNEAHDYRDQLRNLPGRDTIQFTDHPGQDWNALVIGSAAWRIVWARPLRMTKRGYQTVRGGMTPPRWGAAALLERRTDGRRLAGLVMHNPPTVEVGGMRNLLVPVRQQLLAEQMTTAADWVALMRKDYPRAAVLVMGDMNVNERADTNRVDVFPRSMFGHAQLQSVHRTLGFGTVATHGKRWLDQQWSTGLVMRSVDVLGGYGSDHRPIVGHYTL